ncbi:MAG: nuclear transport factor 2 family protein [Steroidobacteraceae bacterium]|nr:nuclear transport factor 2 family protein [Steroidobacteraceae bacterium]
MSNEGVVKELLQRIDRLESRQAMRDLVTDYCQGFDRGDFDRFLSIWWEDCVWDIGPPFGAFAGHAGIEKAVKEVLWPVWRETHHLTSNLKVAFEDADNARGECDVDCMGATRDDVVQMISATYRDHFQRRNGVWKIARRDVTIHYFNPIPGAQMTPPPA